MKKKSFNCPAEMTIHLIKGKWKVILLYHLSKTPKRFGELRRLSPGITAATLTKELRDFEKTEIISRTKIGKEQHSGVEYSLTQKGQSLKPVLKALIRWGLEHKNEFVLGEFKMIDFHNGN